MWRFFRLATWSFISAIRGVMTRHTPSMARAGTWNVIDFKDISKKLLNDLKKFAPHGPCNPRPLFCTHNVYDYGTSKVVGKNQEHIKLELVDSMSSNVVNGIAFGQSASARFIKSKRSFDIVYNIVENAYKHGEVQLQIEDIKPNLEN